MTINKRIIQNQLEYAEFVVDKSRSYCDFNTESAKREYLEKLQNDLNNQIKILEEHITLKEHEADYVRAMIRAHEEEYGDKKEDD